MATATTELVLKLKTTDTGVTVSIDKVNSKIKEVGRTTDATEKKLKSLSKTTKKLSANINSFGNKAGIAFTGLATSVGLFLKTSGRFEQWEIAFTTMLGSAEKATMLLKDITKFAAETPFELTGLVESSKQLIAFGFAQQDIITTLKSMGDIAAGIGTEKLPTLINAFGKIRTKGKASMEELNRILEAGVPILDELAIGFDVTTKELLKMVSRGEVGFNSVDEALKRLTTGNGKFADLMDKQSRSLDGVFSNIKDNITQIALSIGNRLLPKAKELSNTIKDLTEKVKDMDPAKIERFAEDLVKVTIALGGLFVISKITALVLGLTDSFIALRSATLFLGPAGIMVIGLTSIASLLVTSALATDKFRESLGLLNKVEKKTFTEQQLRSKQFEANQTKELNALENKLKALEQERETVRGLNLSRKRQLDEEIRDTRKSMLERNEAASQYYEQQDVLRAKDLAMEKEANALKAQNNKDNDTNTTTFTQQQLEKRKLELGIYRDATISMSHEALVAQQQHINTLLEDERLSTEQRKQLDKELTEARLKQIEKERQAYIQLRDTFTKDVATEIVDGNGRIEDSFDRLGKTIQKKLIETVLNNLINKLVDVVFNFDKATEAGNKTANAGGGGTGLGGAGSAIGGAVAGPVGSIVGGVIGGGLDVVGDVVGGIGDAIGNLFGFSNGGIVGINKYKDGGLIPIPKYQGSGILPGDSTIGDTNLGRFNSGEMLLNQNDQVRLFRQLKSSSNSNTQSTPNIMNDNKTVTISINGTGKTGEQIFQEISPYLEPALNKEVVKQERGEFRGLLS